MKKILTVIALTLSLNAYAEDYVNPWLILSKGLYSDEGLRIDIPYTYEITEKGLFIAAISYTERKDVPDIGISYHLVTSKDICTTKIDKATVIRTSSMEQHGSIDGIIVDMRNLSNITRQSYMVYKVCELLNK